MGRGSNLVFKGCLLLDPLDRLLGGGGGAHTGKVGDDLLGVLSLARPGLPGNQDGLVLRL